MSLNQPANAGVTKSFGGSDNNPNQSRPSRGKGGLFEQKPNNRGQSGIGRASSNKSGSSGKSKFSGLSSPSSAGSPGGDGSDNNGIPSYPKPESVQETKNQVFNIKSLRKELEDLSDSEVEEDNLKGLETNAKIEIELDADGKPNVLIKKRMIVNEI